MRPLLASSLHARANSSNEYPPGQQLESCILRPRQSTQTGLVASLRKLRSSVLMIWPGIQQFCAKLRQQFTRLTLAPSVSAANESVFHHLARCLGNNSLLFLPYCNLRFALRSPARLVKVVRILLPQTASYQSFLHDRRLVSVEGYFLWQSSTRYT